MYARLCRSMRRRRSIRCRYPLGQVHWHALADVHMHQPQSNVCVLRLCISYDLTRVLLQFPHFLHAFFSFPIFVMHPHFEGNPIRKYHAPSKHAAVACLTCNLLDSGSAHRHCPAVFDLLCTTPLPRNISLEVHCAPLVAWVKHVGLISRAHPGRCLSPTASSIREQIVLGGGSYRSYNTGKNWVFSFVGFGNSLSCKFWNGNPTKNTFTYMYMIKSYGTSRRLTALVLWRWSHILCCAPPGHACPWLPCPVVTVFRMFCCAPPGNAWPSLGGPAEQGRC